MSRKRLYEIVEKAENEDIRSAVYDLFMIVVILVSLIPLAFKQTYPVFNVTDRITVVVFIIDYILHWITADYKFGKRSIWSFIRYPFSPMAIVDLLSILPSLHFLHDTFRVLRVLRLIRAMRVFRIVKALRYSRNLRIVHNVIKNCGDSLSIVCAFAIGYIFISALVIFNVEPQTFDTFFDAVYWATVSLTTVGYGDLYPVTTLGRTIAMISSFLGIAVVALPASIITAGYMSEVTKMTESGGDEEEETEES